jgi:copper chaperone CopZ
MNRMATVEYDRAIVAVSDIAKAVNDLGYVATLNK